MDYLYQRNRLVAREFGPEPTVPAPAPEREITARDADVVVIGGGDTGADCVGNALREGARSITQLELLPEPPEHRPDDRTPWPQWPLKYRLSYAMEEARKLAVGEQDYSVTTTRFTDDGSGRGRRRAHRPRRARPALRPGSRLRARAAGAAGAAGDGLPRPRAGAARQTSAWRWIRAATSRRSSPTRPRWTACSPRATPAAASR